MLKFWKYTNKKEFIKLLLIRAIVISLTLLNPLIISSAIDNAINKNIKYAIIYILLMLLISVSIHFFYVLEDYYFGINDLEAYINQFSQINNFLKVYDNKKNNLDNTRMTQELGQNFEIVQPFIYKNILEIIINTSKFIVTCFIVYFISKWILLAFLIIIPISAIVSYKSEVNISNASSDHLENMKKIKGYLIDQKNVSKEERFLEKKQLPKIENYYKKFRNDLIRKVKYESFIYNIFVYGTLNFSITLTTIISIILITKGEMTAGDYTAVSLYISNLWNPILDLFNIRREYVSGKPALKSYNEFLNIDSMKFNNEKIKEIILKDYVGLGSDGKKLHKSLNLKFKKGKVNLIVGSNGVGKTTLAESILNLSNRYEGQILINGDILNKQGNILYKDIVYIPAEPIISQYGILNRTYSGSSGQKKLAQLELVSHTKRGVYIFDEPTNFLDEKVKVHVLNMIESLLEKDAIVIVISHDNIFKENTKYKVINLSK